VRFLIAQGVRELLCFGLTKRAKLKGLGMSRLCHLHMNRFVSGNLLFSLSQAGCSHDPNVRKQGFLMPMEGCYAAGRRPPALILRSCANSANSLNAATTFPKSRISTSCACSRPDRLVRREPQRLKERTHESTVF